jgi:hypothetical protein
MPTPVILHPNKQNDGSIQCECDRTLLSHKTNTLAALKYVICKLVTVIMYRDCLKHSFAVKGETIPE